MSEEVRVIWRRKWRILAVALVLAAVVYFRSDSAAETFRAEGLLLAVAGDNASPNAAARLGRTAAALAATRPIAVKAATDAKLRIGATETLVRVNATASGDGFVTLVATGTSPRDAERLAGAVADALVATVRLRQEAVRKEVLGPAEVDLADVERRLTSRDLPPDAPLRTALLARYQELSRAITATRLVPLDRLEVASSARASSSPVAPTPARDALLTFLAALFAFSVVAVAVEALSDRLSTERPAEEATRLTGLPVLAEIPRSGGVEVIEAFRALRTSLMFMSTSDRLRTLAVVSVDPGAGKTFLALNLSREAAALEVPVVLVDGDVRRPTIHDRLHIHRSPGLSDALVAGSSLEGLDHAVDSWLRVVPAGAPVADPAGLFAGRSFRDALDAMTWAELVVVDTPAGGLFADAMAIASQCDATLVVVDAQASRRRPLRRLVEGLRQVAAQPIGVVLTRTEPMPRPSYYNRPNAVRSQSTTADATTPS